MFRPFAAAAMALKKMSASTDDLSGTESDEKTPETQDTHVSEASLRVVFSSEELFSLRENVKLRQLLTDREMEVMCEYVSGSSRSACCLG